MKKITFILCFALMYGFGFAQNFVGGGTPVDTQNGNGTTDATCGTPDELNLTVDVTGVGVLGTINTLDQVDIDITHTWSGDVQVFLIAPDGTTQAELTSGNGGSGDNYTGTQFRDDAPTAITAGAAPFTGAYTPEEPLSTFNGVDADGTWTLNFCDSAGGDVGTFNSWSITFATIPLCTPAVVNGTSIINDCGIGEFSIEVDVDSVGEADFINDGTTDYPIVAGSNIVGPYPSGSTITLSVVDTEDSDCDFSLADVTFTCPTIPGVDAILTINGCSDFDSFNDGLYDASVKNIYWAQLDYDGGCFELTIDTEGGDFDTEIGLYDSNGFLIGNDDDGGTGTLSIFTEVALPAGTYYIAAGAFNMSFGPDNFNVTSTQTATTGSLFINASTPSDNTVDFCNIQFPGTANIQTGDELNVFAQVFEAGVTEPQGEQGAGIEAWIGYSETDATTTADFTSGDWTWVVADYNTSGPANNNDEYFAEIGSGRAAGTYYYVSRFSIDGGPFVYGGSDITDGDGGNFWDGTAFVSGILNVTNPPPPANDDACNAIMLNIGDASSGAFYTNAFATVEPGEVPGSCYFGTPSASESVWFSFVAPASGEVLIATEDFGGDGTLDDTQITLFTLGDCSDLSTATEIACDEDDDENVVGDGSGLQANLQVTGLISGNTYYFVVDGFGANVGTFDVALSDPTLSIGSLENEMAFTYFPNPVSGVLTLKAQQSIQNVTVLNMLGQEILITSPNALESNLDMSALNTGYYFVKVTINNVTETVRIIKN